MFAFYNWFFLKCRGRLPLWKKRASFDAGFSLVEIALALIVMGLLTAGVMGGYGLVKKARLERTVTQLSSLRLAVDLFLERYAAWPGDFSEASHHFTGARDGNGNGIIEGEAKDLWSEAGLFWQHLSLSGLWEEGRFLKSTAGDSQTGLFIPKVALGCGLFVKTNPGALEGVWVLLADPVSEKKAFLKPSEAQKLDEKLSNGDPNSGHIRVENDPEAPVHCVNEGRYNMATNRACCFVYMRLDAGA